VKGPQEVSIQAKVKPGSAVGSDQVAQGFTQMGLKTSKKGDSTISLGNLLYRQVSSQ